MTEIGGIVLAGVAALLVGTGVIVCMKNEK